MISPIELVDAGVREARRNLADQPQPRARLLFALGEIYSKLGKGEQAIAVVEEAVAIERGLPAIRPSWRATWPASVPCSMPPNGTAPRSPRCARRAKLLEDDREADPGLRSEVLTSLSLAQARTGQIAAAIADAEESARLAAIEADGGSGERLGEANNALSEAHWRNGDLAMRSRSPSATSASSRPKAARETRCNLAETYLAAILVDQGQRDRAEALLRECDCRAPEDAGCLERLADHAAQPARHRIASAGQTARDHRAAARKP